MHPGDFIRECRLTVSENIPHHELLPDRLTEPYYYLSRHQRPIILEHLPSLRAYAPLLPVWVPHRRIAEALGYSAEGIQRALQHTGGRPYVWATEFENVHSYWIFNEPKIVVDGIQHSSVESYYHSQKPHPFDSDAWNKQRVSVMRRGLGAKFSMEPLIALLASTAPHPLVAIKPDSFWGLDPLTGGENMLGTLLEEIREKVDGTCI